MLSAYNQFLKSIQTTREVETLFDHLHNNLKLPNDLSDLLRMEIVYAVSAFDTLIHELTRIGMLDIFNGRRPPTERYWGFSIDARTLEEIRFATPPTTLAPEQIFDREIRLKHSHLAFQDPPKVTEALSHFWNESHKWQKIANQMGLKEDECKRDLKLIVARRNQIVHEFDLDFVSYTRRSITLSDAKNSAIFIENLGSAIFTLVK